jgi:hypothetical protein
LSAPEREGKTRRLAGVKISGIAKYCRLVFTALAIAAFI